jgi:hypothetical protein
VQTGFLFRFDVELIALALVVGLLVAAELGNLLGRRARADVAEKSADLITSALLTLLALLLGFGVSMAESRYSLRIQRMLQETKAISTAYSRADLMAVAHSAKAKSAIQSFLAERIEFYRAPYDENLLKKISTATDRVEDEIWRLVRAQVEENPRSTANILIVNAINEMFDSRSEEEGLYRVLLPWSVSYLLLLASILVLGLTGYGFGLRGARHFVFLAMLSIILGLTLFVMLDLDRPRRGLIKIAPTPLVQLHARVSGRVS